MTPPPSNETFARIHPVYRLPLRFLELCFWGQIIGLHYSNCFLQLCNTASYLSMFVHKFCASDFNPAILERVHGFSWAYRSHRFFPLFFRFYFHKYLRSANNTANIYGNISAALELLQIFSHIFPQ